MMSESMVERVGNHIEAAGLRWLSASGDQSLGWADIPNDVLARAAIEAMRPPESHPDDPEWVGENARVINDWINAALNPQTPA